MSVESKNSRGAEQRGRGLSLFSGGLDSQLAVLLLREQGVEMEGVVFESPFFKIGEAVEAAKQLGLKLHIYPFTSDIMELVSDPPHGFGSAMNPCIDCHARMIKRAGEMMVEGGFDFVSTGEVLNQRPMSQNRRALGMVEKASTLSGRLLRPLSAKLLEPTIPELEGVVDRERLLDLNGRSRKPQLELAAYYGLKEFPAPAGGCLLTEKGFCGKLADLIDHGGGSEERLVRLLLRGRHFRLPGGAKCIVGRDARENALLKEALQGGEILLHTVYVPGPTALLSSGAGEEDINAAAGICASYGDSRGRESVTVRVVREGVGVEVLVPPMARTICREWML